MTRKNYSLGVILIFIGLMFLLMNLSLLTFDWLLFILAVGLIVWDLIKGNMVYLIAGLLLLGISSVALIDEYLFTAISVKSFIYQLTFGIISLVLYGKHGNKGFLILGTLLSAMSINSLIEETATTDVSWTRFLLFAIAFFISYVIGYRKESVDWPRNISVIMLIASAISLLGSKDLLKIGFWKFISYLVPAIIILFGIKIIYNGIKESR
ncbi:hypothetical protein CIW83_00095 [Tissierella sp. P1]|uniref:hypothetical protein n=1 Tax=Tissierella sp. P1 TaxID=1280483 RepID=UPI000BA14775|nr:hypothetical protein [Tissierella sp. P1]OZV13884.1 hypothetical protein CIW83_00095 [Tissierella sp. P1]